MSAGQSLRDYLTRVEILRFVGERQRRRERAVEMVVGALLTIASVTLLFLCLGCGAHAPTQARRVVTVADRVQVAGIEAFIAWDDLHQGAIAERSDPVEDRRAVLDAYRKDRARVVAAFSALAHVSHAAKETIDAFEAGTVKDVDWIKLVAALAEAARALRDVGKAVGFVVPGLEDLIASTNVLFFATSVVRRAGEVLVRPIYYGVIQAKRRRLGEPLWQAHDWQIGIPPPAPVESADIVEVPK